MNERTTRVESNIQFDNLMQHIWEGSPAYDLQFPITLVGEPATGEVHNACHMLALMYPEQWAARTPCSEQEDAPKSSFFKFPDGSQLIVYDDGDGLEVI